MSGFQPVIRKPVDLYFTVFQTVLYGEPLPQKQYTLRKKVVPTYKFPGSSQPRIALMFVFLRTNRKKIQKS